MYIREAFNEKVSFFSIFEGGNQDRSSLLFPKNVLNVFQAILSLLRLSSELAAHHCQVYTLLSLRLLYFKLY